MNVPRPFNKYIAYLTIFAFLALYIICFVFLFNTDSEVISFGCLTLFSIFFFFFIIDTIGSYVKNYTLTFITGLSWFTLFAGMTLKIASLILVLIMFRSIYSIKDIVTINTTGKNTKSNKDKKSNIPLKYLDMIDDYKILFIINMSFILVLMFVLMYNYTALNINFIGQFNNFMEEGTFATFNPLIGPFIIILISLRLLGSSAYEVYIGNELFKLKNKRVT